ncbi:FtsX-like permease family protein [bacterium]|nr:FtsX-like permease family protein [bacterium]
MTLLAIAWKSMRQRSLSSLLTALSVALGVMLMVAVLVINGIVSDTFRQKGTGFNLIISSPGSDLATVLSCVYRIGLPGEPLPWRFYEEDILKNPAIESAIPMTMGDATQAGGFPIVGTTAEFFGMEYEPGKHFRVKGQDPRKLLTGPFDAIIGDRVARENGWDLGSEFSLIHGGMDDHVHDEKFKVVGILAMTGTANDKTVFVNLDGFFSMSGHDKPATEALKRLRDFGYEVTPQQEQTLLKAAAELAHHGEEEAAGDHAGHEHHGHFHSLPNDLKEVSFILVRTKRPAQAIMLTAEINEGVRAMAVNPIRPMARFLDNFVGSIRTVLLFLTALIVVVAGVGIFVSIYNSMADRRREIAIMRALGAQRVTVMLIILGESLLLCLSGGLLGFTLGHGLVFVAAPFIESRAGILVNPFKFELLEIALLPMLLVMAILAGVLPGLAAYRTDVASSLSD